MKEKKMVIVIGGLRRCGAERVIWHITNYLVKQGWQIWIILLLYSEVDYVMNERVHIVDLSGNTESRIKRLPNWLIGIRKTVNKVKPDVVLSFIARINIITQIACLGIKSKMIISERNDPYSDGRSKFVDLLTSWLYPKADIVIFQTKRALSYFNNMQLKNTYILRNPVSVQCLAKEAKEWKIVSVGRLDAQKNQKMLIDAFAKMKEKFPNYKLYIYGEGSLRTQLSKQIKMLGLSGNVILKGNVLDIHSQIADASMFVLSSNYEGLSNALLEAMMMGLPCISTNCAGSDEVIVDGINGVLVPVGNVDALSAAMIKIADDKSFAHRIGLVARNTAEVFKTENVMEQWISVIEKV